MIKIKKTDVQTILLLTIIITTITTIQSLNNTKQYLTNMDWQNHLTNYYYGIKGNYPNIYWAYPLNLIKATYIHLFITIPLLILLLNYSYNKKECVTNTLISLTLLIFTHTIITFIDHGYLKQILFTETAIIILSARYFIGKKAYALTLVTLLIQPITRTIGDIMLPFKTKFNNIGYYLLNKGQFMGLFEFILTPIAIIKTKQKDIKYLSIIAFIFALFETRIILTLFILLLPQLSELINNFFHNKVMVS